MIGMVVVAHADLAEALLDAARMIFGDVPQAEALSVKPGDQPAEIIDRLRDAIRKADPDGRGVVVFTDLFGGTPTNVAMSFLSPGRLEVVTGVNLPMLIKFITHRTGTDPEALGKALRSEGQRSILVASEVLKGGGGP